MKVEATHPDMNYTTPISLIGAAVHIGGAVRIVGAVRIGGEVCIGAAVLSPNCASPQFPLF